MSESEALEAIARCNEINVLEHSDHGDRNELHTLINRVEEAGFEVAVDDEGDYCIVTEVEETTEEISFDEEAQGS